MTASQQLVLVPTTSQQYGTYVLAVQVDQPNCPTYIRHPTPQEVRKAQDLLTLSGTKDPKPGPAEATVPDQGSTILLRQALYFLDSTYPTDPNDRRTLINQIHSHLAQIPAAHVPAPPVHPANINWPPTSPLPTPPPAPVPPIRYANEGGVV